MGATLIGLLPTLLLARIERRAKEAQIDLAVVEPASESLLEAA
jgi:hypothetical protein